MKNLKDIRKRQGLTQVELAELSGVSQSKIAFIENNKMKVLDEILQLADTLGVSTDELFGREMKDKTFTGTHAKLLNDVITKLVE